jgi:NAD(P)-dependent dehydrogenase (short-subunit alcohol dehydrogenase family)
MSLYALIRRNGPSGFGYGSTAEDVTAGLDLGGKTILVTGCSSGLGFETMRVLARRGAAVIGTARTQAKAQAIAAAIGGHSSAIVCDLSEPSSVRGAVAAVQTRGTPLDAIICNAGVMGLQRLTLIHGLEGHFFTNHIGHFMLVTGLLDRLAENGRVVMVSSDAHHWAQRGGIDFDNLSGAKGYNPSKAYGQSKFANLVFAKELARRLTGTRHVANAIPPGIIMETNVTRHMTNPLLAVARVVGGWLAFKTIAQGAATQCYVAVHPGAAALSGCYFADCNLAKPRADAEDPAIGPRLWEVSEAIVAGLN